MKNKNFTKMFIVILLAFLLFPKTVFAVTIEDTLTKVWDKETYYTQGHGTREAKYIAKFTICNKNDCTDDVKLRQQVFCIEPGVSFPSGSKQKDYSSKDPINGNKTKSLSKGWTIDKTKQDNLNKVLSCYYKSDATNDNINATIAAQAIVWELITGERTGIEDKDAKNILNGTYKPQAKVSNSLYDLITKKSGIYSHYKSILRCAARFNAGTPSWGNLTTDGKNRQKLSNYNDETQTFSATFSHGSFVSDLFDYYTFKVNDKTANCKASSGATVDGVTCKCDKTKCTFSTKKEVKTNDTPIKVTFDYTYKSDKKTKLNQDPIHYYEKTNFQTLMIGGSMTKSFNLFLYTGDKPTYQIKIKKVDEGKNPISGVTFKVCSDNKCSKVIGTTKATDAKGETTYTGLTKIGDYYVQEVKGNQGYVTDKKIYTVKVSGSNKTGTTSYATLEVTNKKRSLWLFKNTIDSDGEVISLDVNKVCSESEDKSGPKFNITTSDGKNVCLTYDGDLSLMVGMYTYNTAADKCPENTTNELEARSGHFVISKIPAGTYTIKEISSACGRTLPQDYIKTVKISEDDETANVYMYNGVSGVIFNKIDENGEVLDGGLYSLQRKENGVYKDLLLKHVSGSKYKYESNLTDGKDGATYVLETSEGTINITDLVTGEYRFVEKQAPEGYEPIKDKDSTATFVVSDKGISKDGKSDSDFYQVSLVNHKIKTEGSYDSAELIVTIITGRKVINYVLVIGGLSLLLILFVILRKKLKK